jgi:hypothetical protein
METTQVRKVPLPPGRQEQDRLRKDRLLRKTEQQTQDIPEELGPGRTKVAGAQELGEVTIVYAFGTLARLGRGRQRFRQ